MAATGRIVKIIKERDGKFTIMSSVTGRKQVLSLDELLEAVKSEYEDK